MTGHYQASAPQDIVLVPPAQMLPAEEPDWTQWATRLEIDAQGRLTENLSFYMKLRGYAENPQHDFLRSYDYFGSAGVNGVNNPEPTIFAGGAFGGTTQSETPAR